MMRGTVAWFARPKNEWIVRPWADMVDKSRPIGLKEYLVRDPRRVKRGKKTATP